MWWFKDKDTDKGKAHNWCCFSCNYVLVFDSSPSKTVTFYQCPQCDYRYTLHNNKSLTYRWGMPITLVLYGVIFDKYPVKKAKALAEYFSSRDDVYLTVLIEHINEELLRPTQQVSDIFNFEYPNEAELRLFLIAFNEELINIMV